MTGPELWKILLAAKIPTDELTALAKDVGHKEKIASEQGQHALAKLAYEVYQAGAYGTDGPVRASRIFTVLKDFMPFWGPSREKILYGLAEDRGKHRVWAAVHDEVREYISSAAESLPHIVPLPPPTPPTPPTPSTTVVPSQKKNSGAAHDRLRTTQATPAPTPSLPALPLRREEARATHASHPNPPTPPN